MVSRPSRGSVELFSYTERIRHLDRLMHNSLVTMHNLVQAFGAVVETAQELQREMKDEIFRAAERHQADRQRLARGHADDDDDDDDDDDTGGSDDSIICRSGGRKPPPPPGPPAKKQKVSK